MLCGTRGWFLDEKQQATVGEVDHGKIVNRETIRLRLSLEQAMKLANKIARNAPIAVQACKKAINEGLEVTTEEGEVIEEKLFGSCFETHDQKEGMGCFLSREKPKPKAIFTNN